MTQCVIVLSTRVSSAQEVSTLFSGGGAIVKNSGSFRKGELLEGVEDIIAVEWKSKFSGGVMGLQKSGDGRNEVNWHDGLGHVKHPTVMIIPSELLPEYAEMKEVMEISPEGVKWRPPLGISEI